MTLWERWMRTPQTLWVRRAVFQIHLWTGIGVGLYLLMICVTGSVLVYRNELFRVFSPEPVIVAGVGESLTPEALTGAAERRYPDYEVTSVRMGDTPNHAVEVSLVGDAETIRRLFHPYTGEDLGDPLPFGYRASQWMLDLHDNLLGGRTGRRINGIGALFFIVLSATGAVIWWPGIRGWRRSLTLDLRASWRRLNWSMHSAFGFWFMPFVLIWGVSGVYLSFPEMFSAVVDYLEPFDPSNPADRLGDTVLYWLAYLHFGRLGGRGIPGCDRGLCNETTKAVWAVAALVPPALLVTGVVMWWNRVLRRAPEPGAHREYQS
jgi:uncharacterized iron-regulated membrane protein